MWELGSLLMKAYRKGSQVETTARKLRIGDLCYLSYFSGLGGVRRNAAEMVRTMLTRRSERIGVQKAGRGLLS